MSRYYSMAARVSGYDPERIEAIKDAASTQWDFDDWTEYKGLLSACTDGSLYGGETEEEFAQRLVKAIWTANGAYCRIEVHATYLEELPCEAHCFDEDDYRRLFGPAGEKAYGQ